MADSAGKSNKEIGAERLISEGTVKSHVKSIFAKLDGASWTEAVATATRRGGIELQPKSLPRSQRLLDAIPRAGTPSIS